MGQDAKNGYDEKLRRYVTALYKGKPDRVPLRIFAEEFSAKYCGVDNYATAVDLDLQFDVNRRFAVETGIDAIQTNSIVNWFGMQKALGWDGVVFPGLGLPVDTINQWGEPNTEEEAFLKATEYDEFIDDPTAFMVNRWLPRFTTHMVPEGSPVTFEHNMSYINGLMAYNKFFSTWGAKHGELVNAGVVPAVGSVLKAPLDIIGDKLRGYVNLCYDLGDRRDKVIELCEALMPHLLNVVAGAADPSGDIPSIIWMHRGCVPFISKEDFREIYWPTLKPIIEELWARGTQLVLYAEGDWEEHLDALAELPEKSVVFHLDQTDIIKARDVLGNKFALSGGVHNDLLAFGSTKDVENRCKYLIDEVAGDGGYIMDASALILNDAKVENVKAMIDFTLDYGTYSSGGDSVVDLEALKPKDRTKSTELKYKKQKREPGTCISWDEKKKDLPEIDGDETPAKKTWEDVDSLGYGFCWTSLTW